MTTLAPVLDLVGDIGEFSLFNYGGARWVAYLRQTGALELHRSGDGITEFIGIDVPYPKRQVSVVVVGEELLIFWVDPTVDLLYLSTWHLGLRYYTQMPTALWTGTSPSLTICATTKVVLAYVDASGQHVYRVSIDEGASWSGATIVDNIELVRELDIDSYPSTSQKVFWAETSDEGI